MLLQIGPNLAHIQAEKLQIVFNWQKAPGVNGLSCPYNHDTDDHSFLHIFLHSLHNMIFHIFTCYQHLFYENYIKMSLSLKQLKEENEKLRRDLQESNQARDEEKKR